MTQKVTFAGLPVVIAMLLAISGAGYRRKPRSVRSRTEPGAILFEEASSSSPTSSNRTLFQQASDSSPTSSDRQDSLPKADGPEPSATVFENLESMHQNRVSLERADPAVQERVKNLITLLKGKMHGAVETINAYIGIPVPRNAGGKAAAAATAATSVGPGGFAQGAFFSYQLFGQSWFTYSLKAGFAKIGQMKVFTDLMTAHAAGSAAFFPKLAADIFLVLKAAVAVCVGGTAGGAVAGSAMLVGLLWCVCPGEIRAPLYMKLTIPAGDKIGDYLTGLGTYLPEYKEYTQKENDAALASILALTGAKLPQPETKAKTESKADKEKKAMAAHNLAVETENDWARAYAHMPTNQPQT